jgi:hypothetical protein
MRQLTGRPHTYAQNNAQAMHTIHHAAWGRLSCAQGAVSFLQALVTHCGQEAMGYAQLVQFLSLFSTGECGFGYLSTAFIRHSV